MKKRSDRRVRFRFHPFVKFTTELCNVRCIEEDLFYFLSLVHINQSFHVFYCTTKMISICEINSSKVALTITMLVYL